MEGKEGVELMSMRLKLFLSYLVMGFIPIILLITLMFGIMYKVVSTSPFLMSLDNGQDKIIQSIDELLNIEILTRDNPEGLFDKEMLAEVDTKLSTNHVGMILLDSNKQLFYISSFLDQQTILQEIRIAEQEEPAVKRHFKNTPPEPFGYERLDLQSDFMVLSKELGNDGIGTLYLAIETGPTKKITDTYLRRFMTFIFWGMVGLILLMTFLVTRSMMQSLKKLKDGVYHISEGDLNFSIKTNKRDEVAQVVMAFEEMRLRLKASIEAQVKEDENRKELISNISHDLKTPVTAIKGYVEGLIDGVADTPEKKEKYLSTVLVKTIALDRMIDDLFLYSSLNIGRITYHYETLFAMEFFENLCSETKLDLTERDFEVICNFNIPHSVKIKVDRQMLHRLQHNLTENAAKYSKSSGKRVIFSVCVHEGELLCSTEDNGIGIQESEMPHIFERFYRADAARTSTIGGTGLGLQISRRIIEDHGGRIWAESSYGEFTRISWTLPVLPEEGITIQGENSRKTDKQSNGGNLHA